MLKDNNEAATAELETYQLSKNCLILPEFEGDQNSLEQFFRACDYAYNMSISTLTKSINQYNKHDEPEYAAHGTRTTSRPNN